MKLQFGPLLVILAFLSVQVARAQVGSGDSSQSGSTDSSSQSSSEGPQPVFTHPEDKPPLALLDEVTSHNYIQLGLGAGAGYDTNAAVFSEQHYSQVLGMISPSIQLTQTRPNLTWNVGVFGSLTMSSVPGYYTTANPAAQAGFLYQISPRWQLNVSDNYVYTSDPFQQYTVFSSAPTYNQPNPTVYAPLTTSESNYGVVDLTYEIGAHDSVTFTGTENFRRFLYTSYSLYNLYSYGGVAQYQHVFSARFSAGAGYGFTALDFGHGQSRSGINLIQAFASYVISPHMSVSGWVGPEYTVTKNLVPIFCTPRGCFIEVIHNRNWDTAFGGNFGWQGQRNSAVLSFSKSISDGGVLLGIVQLYQVNASYIRQLNPRWNASLSMLYGNNTGFSTLYHAQHLNSFSGYVGLTRQFTPAWSAILQYGYFYETQQNLIGAVTPKWTDNRFQFTLQYNWGHSLGR
jgi:hypothetical protein